MLRPNLRRLRQQAPVAFTGLVAGLVLAMVFAGWWPRIPLHATATHGEANFAIATGPIDGEVEGIYFLDFLTGDLKCAVIAVQAGPRMGKFNALFSTNVLKDFKFDNKKNPRFLMVTGLTQFKARVGNVQPANSTVYLAEAAGGHVVAYTVPWNQAMANARAPQQGPIMPLDTWQARQPLVGEGE